MNYLAWNNIIGGYFFNPSNAGKDIHLYITKEEIIALAKEFFPEESNDLIWKDFIRALKNGITGPSKYASIIEKAIYALEVSHKKTVRIEGIEIKYPAYIAYLVLFVLPLIEIQGDYRANNYYSRLEEFLATNGIIGQKIGSTTFQWSYPLWEDLNIWANQIKQRDLGSFTVRNFGNDRWVWVGKPFSQCIFPPKSIRKLPELFLESGMVPNSFYPSDDIRMFLIRYGSSILGLREGVIDIIKNSNSNELGESIIEIAKREYNKWTGESHQVVTAGPDERTKRNYTVASLLLQFKLNINSGKIIFSYRMYSSNDYPEDLKFGEFENVYEFRGFSKTLSLPFREAFEIKDDFNKWLARFPAKEVRLFINASTLQLSSGYWIETDNLSKTDWMYLLCRSEKKSSIIEWGRHFKLGNFTEEPFDGIPNNYSLFRILNPRESHKEIPILTIHSEKSIRLIEGLKINFRTFIRDFLPEVEILNADGTENVFLQYRYTEDLIPLRKKQSHGNRWLLPEDISLNRDFYIKVGDEKFSGNEIAYTIISSEGSALKIEDSSLPIRDHFGKRTTKLLLQYCLGSNIINPPKLIQKDYCPFGNLFTSINEDINTGMRPANYDHIGGNILLSFLTLKSITSTEDFYLAFEYLFSAHFGNNTQESNANFSKTKNASINFYDYLGYLDYDYETKKIIVNPPQLIFIPSAKGRRCLLIGGRDPALVKLILESAPKHNLQLEITKQFTGNENLLLPDAITVKSFGTARENYGESNLKAFASELGIKFSYNEFLQLGLEYFSADLEAYEKDLLANNETNQDDYGWARRIFDVNALNYIKNESVTFDKTFALVEYKLNEYTYYNKLWIGSKCYLVDRNWGKYLALKHYKKQVILYDRAKEKVAIPVELALPRLLAESIMLLSGLAPAYAIIESKQYRIYENIPSVFIQNLFGKLKQKPIDHTL